MKIVLKFVLNNILEKKFRTFLIVFAIIISTALLFASSAITTTMEAMFLRQMEKYTGSAEILIQADKDSESPFFSPGIIRPWAGELEYAAGSSRTHGFYQHNSGSEWFQVQGVVWTELEKWNPAVLTEQQRLWPFNGRKIVLSAATADRLGLSLGDTVVLEIDLVKQEFLLVGIAGAEGPFQEDGRGTTVMVPQQTLADILGHSGMVSTMYLKGSDPQQMQVLLAQMQAQLTGFTVLEAGLDEQAERALNSLVMPFMMVTGIIFLLSAYIIFTSFRLITVERLPVIGTFRSVGATKAKTNLVLLAEGLVYGVLGGTIGCIVGLGILRLMTTILASTTEVTTHTPIVFTWGQVGAAMIAAVVLTFVSSLLPILSTGKVSLKDIILNSYEHSTKGGRTRTILGFVFLVTSLVTPRLASKALLMPVSLVAIVLQFAAIVLLVSFVTGLLVKVMERVYALVAGNIGLLAAKNLRENKSLLNSVTLLALGIGTLLLINTLTFSVLDATVNVWGQNITGDIGVQVPGADMDVVEEIAAVDGVVEVMPTVSLFSVGIEGSQYNISWLEGIRPGQYLNFYSMDLSQGTLDTLGEGRNIILATFMADLLEVVPGDTITLSTPSGPREYTLTGIVPILFNNGMYGIVDVQMLQEDMQITHFTDIFVNSSNTEATAAALSEALNYRRAQVTTIQDLADANYQSNQQIFSILQGFSILMMIIGVVGVINNLLVSFIQRRRTLAMLRSVGMSQSQIRSMVLWESLTGGIIGGALGVGSGLLMLAITPWVLEGMLLPVPLLQSNSLIVWSWLAGVLVMVFASVAPALRTSRLNIIKAISFE